MNVGLTEVQINYVGFEQRLDKCPKNVVVRPSGRLFSIKMRRSSTKLSLLADLVDGLSPVDSLLDKVLLQEFDAKLCQ